MFDASFALLPPLQGCLYCHAEGTTALYPSRKILGVGGDHPVLKCSRCGTSAEFDADPALPDAWHIRYRHVNRDPPYYYVALHFGGAGWLSAQEALTISTDGYVQRQRVIQAQDGDLSWLQRPKAVDGGGGEGQPFLSLKGVTLYAATGSGVLGLGASEAVLDSGKLYVTQTFFYLDGQRQVWKYPFSAVDRVNYSEEGWTVTLNDADQRVSLSGANAQDQLDAQLIAAVVEALWRRYLGAIAGREA